MTEDPIQGPADARRGLEHDVPPPQPRRWRWGLAFALTGGPLAWFVQLNTNYGLLSQPCYPGPDRNVALPGHAQWVWPLTVILYILCLLVALASAFAAWRIYRTARAGDPDGRDSRDCFLGYSGLMLGIGFAAIILASLLALLMVPPCAL